MSVQRYAENYSHIAVDDIAQDLMPGYYKLAQAEKAISYVGQTQGKRVLDVGVGKGLLLNGLRGCEKLGVDIAPEYLRYIKEGNGIEVMAAVAEHLPFKAQAFDVIFLTDILEHVLDVADVLYQARETLRYDGKVMIRVPDDEDLRKYGEGKYDFAHLRSFDRKSLSYILRRCGFKVMRVEYDGFVMYRPSRPVAIVQLGIKVLGKLGLKFFGPIQPRPLSIPECIIRYLFSYPHAGDVNLTLCRLPNWLGRLLCDPVEISVVCRRVR